MGSLHTTHREILAVICCTTLYCPTLYLQHYTPRRGMKLLAIRNRRIIPGAALRRIVGYVRVQPKTRRRVAFFGDSKPSCLGAHRNRLATAVPEVIEKSRGGKPLRKERVGFEPTERSRVLRFSRPLH